MSSYNLHPRSLCVCLFVCLFIFLKKKLRNSNQPTLGNVSKDKIKELTYFNYFVVWQLPHIFHFIINIKKKKKELWFFFFFFFGHYYYYYSHLPTHQYLFFFDTKVNQLKTLIRTGHASRWASTFALPLPLFFLRLKSWHTNYREREIARKR